MSEAKGIDSPALERDSSSLLKVLDRNVDSVIVVDEAGQILYINDASRSMFDAAKSFRVGEVFGFPVTAGDTTELDIRRASGERLVAEMRVVQIDWQGQSASLASLRDVTLRKINEELLEAKVKERTVELESRNSELKKMYESAARATEAKTRFIGHISHEIRTASVGIVTSCELLIRSSEGTEGGELAKIIFTSAKRLLELVERMLDFSRIDAGKVSVSRAPFDLQEFVEFSAESAFISAKKKHSTLSTRYGDNLPKVVYADQTRLRQVLTNLLNNAVKFTTDGEIVVETTAGLEDGRPVIKIAVKDNGIGIDPADANNIFQPFVQANSSIENHYGGSGLGLAICKELMAAMDGNIQFCSEVRKGSTFWFTFPVGEPDGSNARSGHS